MIARNPYSLPLAVILAVMLPACDRHPAPIAADAGSVDALAQALGELAPKVRALAFADPGGHTRTDESIRKAIGQARQLPNKVDTWLLLGSAWIQKARESGDPGYYAHSLACAEAIERAEPRNLSALALRGASQLSDHRFSEALATAKRMLAEEPNNVVALGMASDASLELGSFDEAVKAAEAMSASKPDVRSYARVAHLRWLRGDSAGAKVAYRTAIEAAQLNAPAESVAWVLVEAANVFFNEGDYSGADKGYELAEQTLAEYAPAIAGRARAALAGRKHALAVDLARRALAARPTAEHAVLVFDALEAGSSTSAELPAARAEVERLGRSDRRTLALFLASTNTEADRAVSLATAELRERPSDGSKDVAAFALLRAGRAKEARELAEATITRGTPDARAMFHAGAVRIALGDSSGRALIKAALKLSPEFHPREAAEARAILRSR
ncbi:MAG: tetratricopeptide repeat protein [Deltaproteobacteria bacterium]|nr:tetratricopeptide repeat protein [Deltaproteobacteria bacterium]